MEENVNKNYIKFHDAMAGLKKYSTDLFAKQHSWIHTDRTESNIRIQSKSGISWVTKRTEFPFMLAWACTKHKDKRS